MARHGMPVIENLIGLEPQATSDSRIASSVGRSYDPSFDWDRLKAMRDNWPRRMIGKGILHPEDADRLALMGSDAIVVSNNGGSQIVGAVAPIDARQVVPYTRKSVG